MSTFEKWQRNYDHDHQTLSWLRCDTDKADRNLVALLWCSVCRNYQDKICSMKNYSSAWVTGTENQRTSNMLDHVACDQHKAAMSHLCTAQAKASSKPVTSYALIIIMSKKWCQTMHDHSWKWSDMLSGHLEKLYLSLPLMLLT